MTGLLSIKINELISEKTGRDNFAGIYVFLLPESLSNAAPDIRPLGEYPLPECLLVKTKRLQLGDLKGLKEPLAVK